MANNKKSAQRVAEKKVVTKYDRKMARRREEEKREKRNFFIAKVVGIVLLASILVTAGVLTYTNLNRIYRQYIKVDGENISQIEFDFYYGVNKNNMLSQTLYGTMTYLDYYSSYMGYDINKKDSRQSYASGDNSMTWYDYFANIAANSILETRALLKDAEKNAYEYTTGEEDYKKFTDDLKENAKKDETSVKAYYKELFGAHATEKNMKPYIQEYLEADAYREKLMKDMEASEEEVSEYYNEHKDTYDIVEYRQLKIAAADSSDEELKAAKESADALLANISDENSFVTLAQQYIEENADEDDSEENNTAVLKNTKSYMSGNTSDWLLSGDRAEGDVTVIEDTDNNCCYVLYYINRSYSGESDESIATTLQNNKYSDYITKLTDEMELDTMKRF